jgi:GntR family phosphonate transport system transcriptional regulator
LEAEIAGGRVPPGGRLPTEQQLSTRFQVNRHTVRRAMEELERCGLVRIEQGRGRFAAEDVIDYQIGPRARFAEVIARQNHAPSHRIVRVTEIAADDPEASSLRSQCGQMLWQVERLGLADGRPVSLGRHHFPQHRLPGLPGALADGNGSIRRTRDLCCGRGCAGLDPRDRTIAEPGRGGSARLAGPPAGDRHRDSECQR